MDKYLLHLIQSHTLSEKSGRSSWWCSSKYFFRSILSSFISKNTHIYNYKHILLKLLFIGRLIQNIYSSYLLVISILFRHECVREQRYTRPSKYLFVPAWYLRCVWFVFLFSVFIFIFWKLFLFLKDYNYKNMFGSKWDFFS